MNPRRKSGGSRPSPRRPSEEANVAACTTVGLQEASTWTASVTHGACRSWAAGQEGIATRRIGRHLSLNQAHGKYGDLL